MVDWRTHSVKDLAYLDWSNRIVFGFNFCITSSILIKELKIRSRIKTELDAHNTNKTKSSPSADSSHSTHRYQKWFNFWSLTAMIAFTLAPLFAVLQSVPILCQYVIYLTYFCYSSQHIYIAFYQLTRLQYTFSTKQIHSSKFGYNKCTFIFLYCYGIWAILFATISWSLFNTVYPLDNIHNTSSFGCVWMSRSPLSGLFSAVGFLFFSTFDILILILYVYKVKKFQRMSVNLHKNVERRISYILNKILFLTLCYQITGIVSSAVPVLLPSSLGSKGYSIYFVFLLIDGVVSTSVAFLMIEHNTHIYDKVVFYLVTYLKFDKWFCCCCLSFYVTTNDQQMVDGDINTSDDNSKKKNLSIHTNSDISLDTKTTNPIDVHVRTPVEESESTKTISPV